VFNKKIVSHNEISSILFLVIDNEIINIKDRHPSKMVILYKQHQNYSKQFLSFFLSFKAKCSKIIGDKSLIQEYLEESLGIKTDLE
jgi:hypothetical protein